MNSLIFIGFHFVYGFCGYYQSTNINVSTNIILSFSVKHGKLIQMMGIPIVINIIVLQISQFVVNNMDFFYYTHSYCGTFKRNRGRLGLYHMVVGFTTTYAIGAYCHWCCELESRSGRGVQHYVIKFFGDLWQVSGFLWVLRFSPPIKLNTTI